jgi:hypothetical protein
VRSDWQLPILDHLDVPIGLKVVPKPVIKQFECSHIRIIIPLNHGMILLLSEVCGHARMAAIHTSKSVEVVGLEQMNHFLDNITRFFFFRRMLT